MRRYLIPIVVSTLVLLFASASAGEQKGDRDTTEVEQEKVEKKKPSSSIRLFDYFIDKDRNGINDRIEKKSRTRKKGVPSRKTKHTTRKVTSKVRASKMRK